jgi:hypothetical protein
MVGSGVGGIDGEVRRRDGSGVEGRVRSGVGVKREGIGQV